MFGSSNASSTHSRPMPTTKPSSFSLRRMLRATRTSIDSRAAVARSFFTPGIREVYSASNLSTLDFLTRRCRVFVSVVPIDYSRNMCTTDAGPLRQLQSAMAGLTQVDPSACSDESVRTSLPALLTALQQLTAVVSGVLGAFDGRDLAELDACATSRSWLMSFGRMTPNAASAWVKRARLLGGLPALREATLTGAVTPDHLRWVLELVDRVGLAAVVSFNELLATLAATLAPADLKVACERIAAHLDPDGPDPDPNGAFERRELRLARVGAMMVLRGQLDPEAGAALLTALDAAMTPPRGGDLRSTGQRRADALSTIVNQVLGAGQLPTVHAVRPHVGILITPDTLLNHNPSERSTADDDDEVLRTRIRHLQDTAEDRADPVDRDRDDEGSPPAD